jgi:hypothetical protein
VVFFKRNLLLLVLATSALGFAEDLDLSLVELTDEQMLFAIAIQVGPTGVSVAGAFDADGSIARLETYRGLEFRSAAKGSANPEQECREQ